jgi:uncharacterized OsmC-like protein
MAEKVIVRQNKNYEVGFWAVDPEKPDSDDYSSVHGLHELTPYGMMLVSLATCTAQIVLAYAENHNVPLDEIEFHMGYERNYLEDCDNCEQINQYEEHIIENIEFIGELSKDQKEKLFKIAHLCPIAKIFQQGINIQTEWTQN